MEQKDDLDVASKTGARVRSERSPCFRQHTTSHKNKLSCTNLISVDEDSRSTLTQRGCATDHAHSQTHAHTHTLTWNVLLVSCCCIWFCVSGLYVSALSKYQEAGISHCCLTGNTQKATSLHNRAHTTHAWLNLINKYLSRHPEMFETVLSVRYSVKANQKNPVKYSQGPALR